jgi:dipeptidyl aminopeptidase/acylaminoacyl peptidase
MTPDLEQRVRAAVRTLSDAVPVTPPDPGELIRRAAARPAHARSRVLPRLPRIHSWLGPAVAAAAVVAVLAMVTAGPALLAGPERPPTGDAGQRPVLPDRLAGVSLLTAPVSEAPSGPAILAYGQGSTGPRWLRAGQTIVLGVDGRTYRRVDLAERRGGPAEWGTWQDAAVVLSPDGGRLAVGSIGAVDSVAVVDLRTGAEREYRLGTPGRVEVLAWSPDGGRLGFLLDPGRAGPAGAGGFRVLDLATGAVSPVSLPKEPLPAQTGAAAAMAFAPDGRRLALQADAFAQDRDLQSIWVVDPAGPPPRRLPAAFGVRLTGGAAWSPDGRWLAVGDNAASGKRAGAVAFLDPAGGGAAAPDPVTIPRSSVTAIGWRSATSLLLTEESASDEPTLYEVELGGQPREVSHTPGGRLGTTNTYRIGAATALLPAVEVHPAAEASRGPSPWWWRLTVAFGAVAVAGLVVLFVRVGRRALARSARRGAQ